jgi:hypothetical protein
MIAVFAYEVTMIASALRQMRGHQVSKGGEVAGVGRVGRYRARFATNVAGLGREC